MNTEKIESTENETPDSLELAKDAINYVLKRIKKDENIRYHMGAFTEAFERLKKAHSALTGISEEVIESDVLGGQSTRKPAAKQLDDIKDIIDNGSDYDPAAAIKRISTLLGR
jgi:methionine synthase II (cobalamin-independent)